MSTRTVWRKLGQWHATAGVIDGGYEARCGVTLRDELPAEDHLPAGEASCNTCLALLKRDDERSLDAKLRAERDPRGVDMAGGGE